MTPPRHFAHCPNAGSTPLLPRSISPPSVTCCMPHRHSTCKTNGVQMLLIYVIDVHIGTNRRKFRTPQLAKYNFTIKRILTRGKKHTRCLPLMRANRTFALFFMVLDLRLVKIGCRETINFFCIYPQVRYLLHGVMRTTEAIPFSEDQVANTSNT